MKKTMIATILLLVAVPVLPVTLVLPAWASDYSEYLSQHFESDGVRIRYVERGAGEPVVLIPEPSGKVEDWIDAGAFTLPYHVIALDYSGRIHSQSSGEMGEHVIRLLDHLSIPKAHIVGYGGSAPVVAYLAEAHADRLLTAAVGGAAQPVVPKIAIIGINPSGVSASKPGSQFTWALAEFLHAHPASRSLWAPSDSKR